MTLELKRAFTDGTTHVLFEPEDFIARLATLVPRPRAHLLRYHGLFAPNAPKRRLIVKSSPTRTRANATEDDPSPSAPMTWMARLQRVFDIDISRCPRCQGELRVIAVVTEPGVITRILDHLNRHGTDPPAPSMS